jgi:hypothetical protein
VSLDHPPAATTSERAPVPAQPVDTAESAVSPPESSPGGCDAAGAPLNLSELRFCRWAGLDEIVIAVEALWHRVII